MVDLVGKVAQYIDQHHLLHHHAKVLIAVSGGVDSVVLLNILFQLRLNKKLKLEIVHLNHGIRGSEADSDQKFVEMLADKYKLSIYSGKVNTPFFIRKNKLSEEEGARILRYRYLNWAKKKSNSDFVALGHNLNDNVETILDHFIRGSGLRGLSGIDAKREHFIRPLLGSTRDEIETYAREMALDYIFDSSNSMLKYRRNRIRHELLPLLQEKYNPAISNVVIRTAKIVSEIEADLEKIALDAFYKCRVDFQNEKIILDINCFLSYFITIQKYIIYCSLEHLKIDRSQLTNQKIECLLDLIKNRNSGSKYFLNKEWVGLIDGNTFVIMQRSESNILNLIIHANEIVNINKNYEFASELISNNELPETFPCNKNEEFIDFDKVKGQLYIRNFRQGDRFRPLNFRGEKKLSDYFIDNKIPLHVRKKIPLLVCDAGVIWIMGFQIDDRYKITTDTRRILRLIIKEGLAG